MKFAPIIILFVLIPTLLLSQPEDRCPYYGPQLPATLPVNTVGDFTITTTDGITRNLYATLDSGKTVFIDLFYTTCYYCQLHAPVIEQIYQNTGAGNGNIEFWGISNNLFDTNYLIDLYKQQYNITNPCAGPWGGGTTAFTTVVAGQNFSGFPTYCVVCPDRTMFFAPIYPPTVTGFDPYFEICAAMVGTNEVNFSPLNNSLSIYPNPAHHEISLAFELFEAGNTEIKIFSLTGIKIDHYLMTLEKGTQQVQVPVSSLPEGIYLVALSQKGMSLGKNRFIVKR